MAVREVLRQEREWLRGLRWVDRAEWVALAACPVVLGASGWIVVRSAGCSIGSIALAAHAVLATAALCFLPRGRGAVFAGIAMLSWIHYAIFALAGFSQLALIARAYGALSALALLAAIPWSIALVRRWTGIAAYSTRDDFRWLLTRAPLALRLPVLLQLRRR
jgi:hypothetical protein